MTPNPEPIQASGGPPLGALSFEPLASGKHVSPRENAFGGLQSSQNGRLGGAAVTAKVRTLNPFSLELLCASWRLQLGGKHVSPRENAFGGLQSCQNGRLGGAAVTAKVRTLNPLSLELLSEKAMALYSSLRALSRREQAAPRVLRARECTLYMSTVCNGCRRVKPPAWNAYAHHYKA